MVRTHLVPTIMSIRLLSPRLLVAKFRGAQRHLTVYVAHAPHSDASSEDREDFYTTFSEALSDRNEICLLYTSPSPRDGLLSRMPSSA